MTQHIDTHVLDPDAERELRCLDPAYDVVANPARRDGDLASILATPVPHGLPAEAGHLAGPPLKPTAPLPRRRSRRRLIALGVAAAAATGVAAIALPTLTAAPSYASWTAVPTSVTPADTALVRKACLDQQGPSIGDGEYSTKDLRVQLAERRGNFVSMLLSLRTPERMSASVFCIAELPVGSDDVGGVQTSASGGGGLLAPTGRQFTQGAIGEFGGEPAASIAEGEVGPDVAGLTLHVDGKDIVATLKNGAYAVWWPGRAFAPVDGSSGEGGPRPAITYDVTYTDGTVAKDVAPTVPGAVGGEIHTEVAPRS